MSEQEDKLTLKTVAMVILTCALGLLLIMIYPGEEEEVKHFILVRWLVFLLFPTLAFIPATVESKKHKLKFILTFILAVLLIFLYYMVDSAYSHWLVFISSILILFLFMANSHKFDK